jgi:hypothetical protein
MRLAAWSSRRAADDGAEILPPADDSFADDLRQVRAAAARAEMAARNEHLRQLHAGNARLFAALLGGFGLILIPPLLVLGAIFGAITLWALWDLARSIAG